MKRVDFVIWSILMIGYGACFALIALWWRK